jgi:hypothetical protein
LPLWQVLRMSTNWYRFAGGANELHAEHERLTTHATAARQLSRDNTVTRPPEQYAAETALAEFGKRLISDADAQL